MPGNRTQHDNARTNETNRRAFSRQEINKTVREVSEQQARELDEMELHSCIREAKRRADGWLNMYEARQWCELHGWKIASAHLHYYANQGMLRVKPVRRRLPHGGSVLEELRTREEWLQAFIQEARTASSEESEFPFGPSFQEFESRLLAFSGVEPEDITAPLLLERLNVGLFNALFSPEDSSKDIFSEFLGPSPTLRDKKNAGHMPTKYRRANQSALLFQPLPATVERRARRFIEQHSNRLAVAHLAFDEEAQPNAREMYIVWCLDHKTDPDTGERRVCERWIERVTVLREHNVAWANDDDARDRYATLSRQSKRFWLRALQQALGTPADRQQLLRCNDETEAALVASAILRLLRATRAGL